MIKEPFGVSAFGDFEYDCLWRRLKWNLGDEVSERYEGSVEGEKLCWRLDSDLDMPGGVDLMVCRGAVMLTWTFGSYLWGRSRAVL